MKPGIHILRHSFCSHLAMRGAPARAIQELAGHQDLATTQRYMHLSPAALDAAIRLLETGDQDELRSRGEIVEAAGTEGPKAHIQCRKLVEAAGFAPASEHTSPQESTMRIRF